jgi:hypothetical protein
MMRTRARKRCQWDHPSAHLGVPEQAGHALIGARQQIPADHIADPVSSLVIGLPPDLAFRAQVPPGPSTSR